MRRSILGLAGSAIVGLSSLVSLGFGASWLEGNPGITLRDNRDYRIALFLEYGRVIGQLETQCPTAQKEARLGIISAAYMIEGLCSNSGNFRECVAKHADKVKFNVMGSMFESEIEQCEISLPQFPVLPGEFALIPGDEAQRSAVAALYESLPPNGTAEDKDVARVIIATAIIHGNIDSGCSKEDAVALMKDRTEYMLSLLDPSAHSLSKMFRTIYDVTYAGCEQGKDGTPYSEWQ